MKINISTFGVRTLYVSVRYVAKTTTTTTKKEEKKRRRKYRLPKWRKQQQNPGFWHLCVHCHAITMAQPLVHKHTPPPVSLLYSMFSHITRKQWVPPMPTCEMPVYTLPSRADFVSISGRSEPAQSSLKSFCQRCIPTMLAGVFYTFSLPFSSPSSV